MNKFIKYGLIVVAIIWIGYSSVYIKKLSDANKAVTGNFDAKAFVNKLWAQQLPAKLDSAVDLNVLMQLIKADPNEAFSRYTHSLDIGDTRYALIKAEAIVDAVNEDDVAITVKAKQPFNASLVTEFVYGNTLRDASGLIELKDFSNTMDLNNISKELNNIIREKVVPSIKPHLKPGVKIDLVGAIKLNKEHVHFTDLAIVPVSIKISH